MKLFIIQSLLIAYVLGTLLMGVSTAALVDPLVKGNETDRLAQLAIKSMITHDPLGALNSWNESAHFCMWKGIKCGARHKRVTVLDLSSNGLVGSLSPYIGNLSFLRTLYLYNNTFSGYIPLEVGRLLRLETFDLLDNSFYGEIPATISGCKQLSFIQMGSNKLVGKLPSGLGHLSKLQYLGLSDNNLTGDLSPLSKLTSLTRLSLSNYDRQGPGFSGKIPEFIGKFKGLITLDLGGNSFTGQIPLSLYNLSILEILALYDNPVEGVIPSDLGFYFPQLREFQMYFTQLSGVIPYSMSNLSKLTVLDIHNNNFTGKILLDGRKIPNLLVLDFGAAVMGMGEVDELDFLNTLVNCTNLQLLNVNDNNLGGHIPLSIANLSVHIRGLNLGGNNISGSIPSGLGNLLSLEELAMRDNQLTGSIPTDIGKISRLKILYLYNNKLSGNIPSSFGNCTKLLVFGLGKSNLAGNIPNQLFQAPGLVSVYLEQNNFQGSLPSKIYKLHNLVNLNISYNNLSGSIPSSLGQCIALTYLSLRGNSFDGFIPPSFGFLESLEFVDLSDNKLSGQVPKYFSNFTFLAYLNLSFNCLEGDVPTRGIFANASAFFLAGNNKLCGGIPQLKLPTRQMAEFKLVIAISVTVTCFLVCLIIVSLAIRACTKRKQAVSSSSETITTKCPFIKVSYGMLLKATNGFSPTNLIGYGSFSSVYKGNLLLNGTQKPVAIKVINNQRKGASQSFLAECESLRVMRHRNLVGVITACSSTDFQGNVFKAIVYNLMTKGSLERWLYVDPSVQDNQNQYLSLLQRLKIAIDVAHALDYIHSVCKTPFVHCDIKPTNILLDDDLVAHVGDFGLVKLPQEITNGIPQYSSLGVRGTIGYAAPEYGLGRSISAAGDVYSYGILLLEMITAKKPTDVMFEGDMSLHKFAESALPEHMLDILDPKLKFCNIENRSNLDDTSVIAKCFYECIRSMIMIGIRCSSVLPKDRMEIKDVIRLLESQKGQLLLCERHQRCELIT